MEVDGLLKSTAVELLRHFPATFAVASQLFHKVGPAFRSLSPDAADAISRALAGSGTSGDYYEFGIWRGYCLWHAQRTADRLGIGDGMRFFGFDSFAGLPKPGDFDANGGRFVAGQFAATRAEVEGLLTEQGFDWRRGALFEGFFDRTLTPELKARHGFGPVRVAFVDCDLYASTVPVLSWIADLLRPGSIVMFDDWTVFGDGVGAGQPRAWDEFLVAHPGIRARPYDRFDKHGRSFVITDADS